MCRQFVLTPKDSLRGVPLSFVRLLRVVWIEVRVPTAPGLSSHRPKKGSSPRSGKQAALAAPSEPPAVEPPSIQGSTLSLVDEVRVSRAPECDVTLADDPFVSTHHARFFRTGENWFVEDQGSTNGTLVNAQRIASATMLRVDDRVQTDSAVFEVQ